MHRCLQHVPHRKGLCIRITPLPAEESWKQPLLEQGSISQLAGSARRPQPAGRSLLSPGCPPPSSPLCFTLGFPNSEQSALAVKPPSLRQGTRTPEPQEQKGQQPLKPQSWRSALKRLTSIAVSQGEQTEPKSRLLSPHPPSAGYGRSQPSHPHSLLWLRHQLRSRGSRCSQRQGTAPGEAGNGFSCPSAAVTQRPRLFLGEQPGMGLAEGKRQQENQQRREPRACVSRPRAGGRPCPLPRPGWQHRSRRAHAPQPRALFFLRRCEQRGSPAPPRATAGGNRLRTPGASGHRSGPAPAPAPTPPASPSRYPRALPPLTPLPSPP